MQGYYLMFYPYFTQILTSCWRCFLYPPLKPLYIAGVKTRGART
jgi:hypothetical protein